MCLLERPDKSQNVNDTLNTLKQLIVVASNQSLLKVFIIIIVLLLLVLIKEVVGYLTVGKTCLSYRL